MLRKIVKRIDYWMLKLLPGFITCGEADAFIADYLDGRLPDPVRTRFERHIRFCRPCKSYLDAYRRTVALSKTYEPAPGSPAAPKPPEALIQAILAAKDKAK